MVIRLLVLALAAMLAGCESAAPAGAVPAAAPRSTLVPGPVVKGGFPPGAAYLALRAPIAVAAVGPDLYVVDGGAGLLVRIDPVSGRLATFTGRPFVPGTRLAVDADASLYLLDPVSRRIQRFTREGRLLQAYAADATVPSLRELIPDRARGRLLAVDSLGRQLVAFRPLGSSFELLPLRGEPRHTLQSIDALAAGADALYAIDARCACLARIGFDGRVLATYGHGHLQRPERLALDRHGRLFVYDAGARALKVFQAEQLVETIGLGSLGLLEATDLAYAEGWLYVADAPGGQVKMFRIQPPPASP